MFVSFFISSLLLEPLTEEDKRLLVSSSTTCITYVATIECYVKSAILLVTYLQCTVGAVRQTTKHTDIGANGSPHVRMCDLMNECSSYELSMLVYPILGGVNNMNVMKGCLSLCTRCSIAHRSMDCFRKL